MLWIPDQIAHLVHDQIIRAEMAAIFLPHHRVDVKVTDFYYTPDERVAEFSIYCGSDLVNRVSVSSAESLLEIEEGFLLGVCPRRRFILPKAPIVYGLRRAYRVSFLNN